MKYVDLIILIMVMVEGYEEVYHRDGTSEPYVYMGDGVYIHPDDAWW